MQLTNQPPNDIPLIVISVNLLKVNKLAASDIYQTSATGKFERAITLAAKRLEFVLGLNMEKLRSRISILAFRERWGLAGMTLLATLIG